MWLEETPEPLIYALMVVGSDGENVQEIKCTHQEFIDLKKHLAWMRGILPTEQQAGYSGLISCTDSEINLVNEAYGKLKIFMCGKNGEA